MFFQKTTTDTKRKQRNKYPYNKLTYLTDAEKYLKEVVRFEIMGEGDVAIIAELFGLKFQKIHKLLFKTIGEQELIEVYFKEAKQHLCFFKEQTWTFASHLASIHLTAIRYLMLVHAKRRCDDLRICDMRSKMKGQLTRLDCTQRVVVAI